MAALHQNDDRPIFSSIFCNLLLPEFRLMWQKPIQTLTSSPLSTLGWRFYGAPARKKHRDPRHDPFALTKSRVSVSRQVAKLQQVDTRFAVTVSKRCRKIVDFGATPGSCKAASVPSSLNICLIMAMAAGSQYLWGRLWQRKEGTVKPRRDGDLRLIAVDLHPLSPRITHANNYPNLQFVPGDVRDPNVRNKVVELLDGRADLIVADLLPSPHDLTKRDKGLSLYVC